jgi:hypothetical protein
MNREPVLACKILHIIGLAGPKPILNDFWP